MSALQSPHAGGGGQLRAPAGVPLPSKTAPPLHDAPLDGKPVPEEEQPLLPPSHAPAPALATPPASDRAPRAAAAAPGGGFGGSGLGGGAGGGGVGGGLIDTRARLQDFPEGAAIADLESWCREPVFGSWWREAATQALLVVRQLALAFLPYEIVQAALNHPRVLAALGLSAGPPLGALVDDYMPRAHALLAGGEPHVALAELQRAALPSVAALKSGLEARARLVRGPTPLERLDFITTWSRAASRLFFAWLRGLARLCTYLSGLLSVVSGALSFTVVPSIILSVFAAGAGIGQLLLTGSADLLEPAVNALLALTETSKDTAASLSGGASRLSSASPVCSRRLPAATVEQLEGFFESQLVQVSGLINRPEIPRLMARACPGGASAALLVKAYDLGLIDALGRVEGPAVRALLAAARETVRRRRAAGARGARRAAAAARPRDRSAATVRQRPPQSVLRQLVRGGARAALAAAALDAGALAGAASDLARGVAASLAPRALGGGQGSVRRLFRGDGFFAYADERQAQARRRNARGARTRRRRRPAVMSRKAALFTKLVAAPPEYAGQLGGAAGNGAGAAEKAPRGRKAAVAALAPAAPRAGAGGGGHAPAVDLRALAGSPNTYVAVFPGLNSADEPTRRLSNSLALALSGLASAVVFLVHPASEPAPDALSLLARPLAAGRHCLVAINGPARVKGLLRDGGGGGGGGGGGAVASDAPGAEMAAAGGAPAAPTLPSPSSPLEALRGRWQAAAEGFCAARGLPANLVGVVVSELADEGGELPPGVHRFKQARAAAAAAGEGGRQRAARALAAARPPADALPPRVLCARAAQVQDWIAATVGQAHRMPPLLHSRRPLLLLSGLADLRASQGPAADAVSAAAAPAQRLQQQQLQRAHRAMPPGAAQGGGGGGAPAPAGGQQQRAGWSWDAGQQLKLSYSGLFPDQVKLIKQQELFLLQLTAIGAFNPRTLKASYSLACRDKLVGGRVTYDHSRRAVEYRKVLPFPIMGGATHPVVAAEWGGARGAARGSAAAAGGARGCGRA
ncbi:hypothetical protein HT031_002085 [Scenedesmus sp. PABB004]|nr:hypothetical protein HT031_002085 [Scenedesmus sp. PABB004]